MSAPMTRRGFVGNALATGAGLAASSWSRSAGAQAPNEKILVGLIGCGGMGTGHLIHYFANPDVEVIALADVDSGHLGTLAGKVEAHYHRKPQTFADFRKLIEMKELNAVSIATPDHWHAIPFITACLAGKDIYCEKPISHNIREGRAMVDAALKHKRVVQIGTQQRSGEHFKKAIELVRSGALGRVVETHTWNCANEKGLGIKPDGTPPPEVDYDFWLGPAPLRSFNPNRFHYQWRWFRDYGGGKICDWNVHLQDIVHLAMDAWSPKSVTCTGMIANEDDPRDTPDTGVAICEFDSPQGPFTQIYTVRLTNSFSPDGAKAHGSHGILFHGRKGTLFVDRGGWHLNPEKGQGEPQESGTSKQNEPHMRNFLDCIKSRAKTASDIESMHLTTAACHLANISWRVGRKIHWDAKLEKCFRDRELKVADDEANALLGREYRKPWELPQA